MRTGCARRQQMQNTGVYADKLRRVGQGAGLGFPGAGAEPFRPAHENCLSAAGLPTSLRFRACGRLAARWKADFVALHERAQRKLAQFECAAFDRIAVLPGEQAVDRVLSGIVYCSMRHRRSWRLAGIDIDWRMLNHSRWRIVDLHRYR